MSGPTSIASVCVIGLGQMGIPIAKRLIGAGFDVRGVDSSAEARGRLEELGGRAVVHPTDGSAGADCVITLLPNGRIVRQVLLGEMGVFSGSSPDLLVIDMSSSAPSDTTSLGKDLDGLGVQIVDAPVSGGVKRADSGSLTVMLGGAADACERAVPVLTPLASAIHRTGALGTGHAMKAINNFVSACGTVAAMEALLIGEGFGMDPQKVVDVLNGSSGRNNATEVKMKQFVLSGSFASGFATGLMAKDVAIAADLANSLNLSLSTPQAMANLWRSAADALGERSDHTEMMRFLKDRAERDS
jgi:3-hydroxyisobutyrate dehydrogenase